DCRPLILAALLGAIFWNVLTWIFGLPSSSSHALIGGLIGAALAHAGWGSLQYRSILHKVVIPLFTSPLAGFAAAYLVFAGIAWLFRRARPSFANPFFRHAQIVSAAFMALSHGTNDAQKTMGV